MTVRLIAILFFSLRLSASPDLEKAAIKIQSEWKYSEKKYFGSGLLFTRAGKVYCLTSDHVFFHSKKDGVQRLEAPSQPLRRAVFLVSDWAKGLGLLEVTDPLEPRSDALPKLQDLSPGTFNVGAPLRVVGFPYLAHNPISYLGGKVQEPKFDQGIFAELPFLLQIEDSYGEFGMSGGPVLSRTGEFVGILSHQDLTVPGQPQKNLLLIPAKSAFQWLNDYFNNPQLPPIRWAQSAYEQVGGFETVDSGRLNISVERYDIDKGYQACLTLGSKASTPYPFSSPTGYYEKTVDALTKSHASLAYIYGFRKKGVFGRIATTFSTIPELARDLADPQLEPIVWLRDPKPAADLQKVSQLAEELRLSFQNLYYKCSGDEVRLCESLLRVWEAVQDHHEILLKPSDFDAVLSDRAWDAFTGRFGKDKTDSIRSLLESIRKMQNYVTY